MQHSDLILRFYVQRNYVTECVECVSEGERGKPGADPGFQVRGGALKIMAPSGARSENFGGISCVKSVSEGENDMRKKRRRVERY